MPKTTLVLTHQDIRGLVQIEGYDRFLDQLIDRLGSALASFGRQQLLVETPKRAGFSRDVAGRTSLLEWMPVNHEFLGATIKTVGYHPANPSNHGLPTILSSITVFDPKTGHLRAIADGGLLTAIRTGAASAVASRCLARRESSTLGLIGCGAQSITQLHALSRVFPLKTVLVCDTCPDVMASFERRISGLKLSIELRRTSPTQILAESDILCTQTTVDRGAGPVFPDEPHQPHLHVNAVGADLIGKTELPLPFLKRAVVVPDFLDQAIDEGECQRLAPEEIGPDLATLLASETPDAHRDRLTVFDSTGWAIEDLVALAMVIEKAEELGLGENIELEAQPADPKDVYEFSAMPAKARKALLDSAPLIAQV